MVTVLVEHPPDRNWTIAIPKSYQSSSAINHGCLDFFYHFLQKCSTIRQSKQTHAQIVVTGRYRFVFLAAQLIKVYASFGFLLDARNVFDTTIVEGTCISNSLLWNSVLRANSTHGNYGEILKIYSQMRKRGVLPDGFTFPLVIKACASVDSPILCRSVHNHVLHMGFQDHLHVGNALMGMYGKLGQMKDARQLFDRMTIRTHLSWNTMISGFALIHDCDAALEMFRRMESEGLEPNPVTWTSLLSSHARCGRHEETMELFSMMRMRSTGATGESLAVVLSVCANSGAFDKGKVIHGYVIKGGYEEYFFVKNSLISVYGKHGHVKDAQNLLETKNIVSWNALISSCAESGLCDEAFAIFSQLEKSDGYPMMGPDVVSWSAVIGGFASKGRGDDSLELFRHMQVANVTANSVTICSVLSVCAELGALDLGREIHCHVVRALMGSNILVENALIKMYTKCGNLKEGYLVFINIDNRDLISWNSMIAGYGMHGFGEKALRTFIQMLKAGFKPDGVTFVSLLSACSHAGLVHEGRKLFNQMTEDFKINPQMEHYSCMVDLLGRAGLLEEASEIVRNMPMKPNVCVGGALLNSCRMHKNTEVAEEIATELFSLNSEMTGSYMLLSNIYAANRRWEDSARVRVLAKTKGLRKIPGQSWIEVKKKVYTFSAGSTLQTGLEEVYRILQDLMLRMEIEGYILDKSFVLQDVDDIEKKDILYGH